MKKHFHEYQNDSRAHTWSFEAQGSCEDAFPEYLGKHENIMYDHTQYLYAVRLEKMIFIYVKAHAGDHGNERADPLAGKGAVLRFKIMGEAGPPNWFRNVLERYWEIRKEGTGGNRNP